MAKEQDSNSPKKKSKLKIILLILIILLLAMGGAGSYWWFKLRTPTPDKPPSAADIVEQTTSAETSSSTDTEATTPTAKPKTVVNLVNIPTVTVNLADTNPIRYLKIGMDVEVNTSEAVLALDSQIAKVRDAIILVLSGKTYNDLATTAGKLIIKNDISTRLNQILGAPRVVQIYFTEFVIQ